MATPMVIASVWFAVKYAKRKNNFIQIIIASGLSLVIFATHSLSWVVTMGAIFFVLLRDNSLLDTIKKYSAFLLPIPIVLLWMTSDSGIITSSSGGIVGTIQSIFDLFDARTLKDEHWFRLKQLFSMSIGMESKSIYAFMGVFLLITPIIMGAKLSKKWKDVTPFLMIVVLFMLMPHFVNGIAFIFQRFAVFVLPFSLFAFRQNSLTPSTLMKMLLPLLVITWLLIQNNILFNNLSNQDSQFHNIVKSLQLTSKDKVLYLNYMPITVIRVSIKEWHYGIWPQADIGGQFYQSFTQFNNAKHLPVRYIGRDKSLWIQSKGKAFDWKKDFGKRYDYFLLHTYDLPEQFKKHMDTLSIALKSKEWIVLKKIKD